MKKILYGIICLLFFSFIKSGEEKIKTCHGKNYKFCAHECCGLENLVNCKVGLEDKRPLCECKGEKRCKVEYK